MQGPGERGVQARVYEVDFLTAPGGCEAPNMSEESCNTQACPVDCMGAWSGWSSCDAVCGTAWNTLLRTFQLHLSTLIGMSWVGFH